MALKFVHVVWKMCGKSGNSRVLCKFCGCAKFFLLFLNNARKVNYFPKINAFLLPIGLHCMHSASVLH